MSGDWNGDGVDTVGIRRGSTWYLKNSNGPTDLFFDYGLSTDVPIQGDWDGNGTDTSGVFRGSIWYVRNSTTGGAANAQFSFGATVDIPRAWR